MNRRIIVIGEIGVGENSIGEIGIGEIGINQKFNNEIYYFSTSKLLQIMVSANWKIIFS